MEKSAHSRATVKVVDIVGPGRGVSTKLASDRPVVAERTRQCDHAPHR